MKQELKDLILETVDTLGYTLIESQYEKYKGKFSLTVIIYKENGLTADDCSKVASLLSRRLDLEELISDKYNLVVESPGVEYVFKEKRHYNIFINAEIRMSISDYAKYGLKDPVLRGINRGIERDTVSIENDKKVFIKIDIADISKCRLYFNIKKYL